MYKWVLPTLSEVVFRNDPGRTNQLKFPVQQRLRAEREWCAAIAALNALLKEFQESTIVNDRSMINGLVLAGPLPVLTQPERMQISTWAFTVDSSGNLWIPRQLPSAAAEQPSSSGNMLTLPLLSTDPLAAEQFCVSLTPDFGLVMVLGDNADGEPAFQFSFMPEAVWQSWQALRSRLLLTGSPFLNKLDSLAEQFMPVAPDYYLVTQFSRLMLSHLPEPGDWENSQDSYTGKSLEGYPIVSTVATSTERSPVSTASLWQQAFVHSPNGSPDHPVEFHPNSALDPLPSMKNSSDAELLQALAHEVRTPLTTIRTLTRLLLKRKDLNPDVLKRLQIIDRECTEQIDRFSLIFRAVELETAPAKHPLTPLAAVSLSQVFQQNVPRWQEQATQRRLSLEVTLPQKLPMVVADSTMLEQMLTGLIDRITHSLPPGSHIQILVQLAGHQLKLQFRSTPARRDASNTDNHHGTIPLPTLKSIGQLLMFQPETGNLSLNLTVTKNLFQALGGKLIVRQRPQQGEVLTVYLPTETRMDDSHYR